MLGQSGLIQINADLANVLKNARSSRSYANFGMQPTAVEAHERSDAMNRNVLYLVIGLLAAGVVVVGYLYYKESQSGIDIEIGEHGVTIEGN
jgi:hypothetical protein